MPSLHTISTGKEKHRCFSQKQKRKNAKRSMTIKFRRLRTEMEEISKEQESIKEGQRQIREKIETIEEEREQLRKETNQLIQQTAITQIRLALIFNILKAREEGNFAKASHLTQLLRQIIASQGIS